MKYIKVFCCIVIVCLMFSGCNLSIASSIDDLLSPVAPFGDNASVQKAMDDYVKDSYYLKTPSYGEFITSYIFKDIDGDKVDEAICFYEPNNDLGSIYMALLKNYDKSWSVVYSIKGDGKDIYSVSFNDIDDDSNCEIIACWDVINNSTIHNMSIYKTTIADGNYSISRLDKPIKVNKYQYIDYNNDGKQELFVLINDSSTSASAKGQLYCVSTSGLSLLGETKLDGHITNYTNISSDLVDGNQRIYADAITSTGNSMITEIIFWSDHYGTIVSPFYSYSTGFTKGTNRNAMVNSLDIDNDGINEIPLDARIDNLPQSVNALDWKEYKNTVLMHKAYSLFANQDNYLLLVDDDSFNKIIVDYDDESRTLSVSYKDTKSLIYSITPVLKSQYNQQDYTGYELVLENKGYCYLAKFGENSSINTQQLKDIIKSY